MFGKKIDLVVPVCECVVCVMEFGGMVKGRVLGEPAVISSGMASHDTRVSPFPLRPFLLPPPPPMHNLKRTHITIELTNSYKNKFVHFINFRAGRYPVQYL